MVGALAVLCVAGASYAKWRLDSRRDPPGLPAEIESEAANLQERALAKGLDPIRLAYDVVAIRGAERVVASIRRERGAALDEELSSETRRDTFGMSTRGWGASGGDLSCRVIVHHHSGEVLGWFAECSGGRHTWAAARSEYERHLVKLKVRGDALHAEDTFPDVARRADAERGRLLGTVEPADVPRALRPAYETLTSRFEPLFFSRTWCGKGGGPTPGGLAMKALSDAARLDLIRQVLRGPNEGGRLLAAEELLVQGVANQADKETIVVLRQLTPVVETCAGGCSRGPFDVGVLLDDAERAAKSRP